ncbi:LamG domain-containing protein [Aeoliella sp. ICT_H6.2]|uniref:LamG domain-containing protein n=1 Tax=Aeoliella straminimaris TaxID=2954799 RepID=A0A9X2FFA0_9BACT|nr:LamG domain-containing protein [Aeoliella straminimaris]MCO6044661.1 LamG domain-containing protein [Aeoliella straminimaris]
MQRLITTSLLILGLISVTSTRAALVTHYTFDADATASVGLDATLGSAASIDNTDFAMGGGSLALSGAPTTDTAGEDGAISGGSYEWTTSDVRTAAFWMKAGTQVDANPTMLSLGSGTGGGNRFDIRLAGENLRLEVQSGGFTTTSAVGDGEWHHVAVVVPNATSTVDDVEYYIDGAYVGTFSNGQNVDTGIGPLRIGDSYQDTNRDFVGHIDDVRLYDSALSASEIASLVPEPSSLMLLGLAVAAAAVRQRRK